MANRIKAAGSVSNVVEVLTGDHDAEVLLLALDQVAACWHGTQADIKAIKRLCELLQKVLVDMSGSLLSRTVFTLAQIPNPEQSQSLIESLSHECTKSIAKLSVDELVSVGWAFSRLAHRSVPLFETLATKATKEVPGMDSEHMSNLLWAFANINIKPNTKLLQELSARLVRKIDTFRITELATAVWSFASLDYFDKGLYDAIARQMEKQMRRLTKPQELANTAWAFARVNYAVSSLFDSIEVEAEKACAEFQPWDLAKILWAFARISASGTRVAWLNLMAPQVLAKLSGFEPQDLTQTAWALAKFGSVDQLLLQSISQESVRKMKGFAPPQLAELAWSYSKLGHLKGQLLESLSAQAGAMLEGFKLAPLSNMFQAIANCGYTNTELITRIVAEIDAKFADATDTDLLAVSWSLAKLQFYSPGLIHSIKSKAAASAPSFLPKHLSGIALALVKLKVPLDEDLNRLFLEASSKLELFHPQQLAEIAWACVQSGALHPLMIKKCSVNAELKLDAFSGNATVMLLEAFHAQYEMAESLLPKISSALETRMSTLDGEHLAMVARVFGPMSPSLPLFMFWKYTLSAHVHDAASTVTITMTELITIVWALIKAEHAAGPLFERMATGALGISDSLPPRALSELAWLLCTHGKQYEELTQQVARSTEARLAEFNLLELADAACALSQLGECTNPLMAKVAVLLEQHYVGYLGHLPVAVLAQLAGALAKANLLQAASLLKPLLEAAAHMASYSDVDSMISLISVLGTFPPTVAAQVRIIVTPYLTTAVAVMEPQLTCYRPSQLLQLLLTMVLYSFAPSRLLAAKLSLEMEDKLAELSPAELSCLIHTMAVLGDQWSESLLNKLTKQVSRRIGIFEYQGCVTLSGGWQH